MLSTSLALSVGISIASDFNTTHLFNPAWPPHAKFHDVAMLNFLVGSACIGMWLRWRKTYEPDIGALMAALVPIIFWTAFFLAPWLIPGVSLVAIDGQPIPHIGGVTVLPNAVAAFVFVFLSVTGLWRRGRYCSDKRKNS